jgi:hypothetical protein
MKAPNNRSGSIIYINHDNKRDWDLELSLDEDDEFCPITQRGAATVDVVLAALSEQHNKTSADEECSYEVASSSISCACENYYDIEVKKCDLSVVSGLTQSQRCQQTQSFEKTQRRKKKTKKKNEESQRRHVQGKRRENETKTNQERKTRNKIDRSLLLNDLSETRSSMKRELRRRSLDMPSKECSTKRELRRRKSLDIPKRGSTKNEHRRRRSLDIPRRGSTRREFRRQRSLDIPKPSSRSSTKRELKHLKNDNRSLDSISKESSLKRELRLSYVERCFKEPHQMELTSLEKSLEKKVKNKKAKGKRDPPGKKILLVPQKQSRAAMAA